MPTRPSLVGRKNVEHCVRKFKRPLGLKGKVGWVFGAGKRCARLGAGGAPGGIGRGRVGGGCGDVGGCVKRLEECSP